MSVMSASEDAPNDREVATSRFARLRACARVFMNAPLPHFTSNTSARAPSAIFLLTMLETMKGSNYTVEVTSGMA